MKTHDEITAEIAKLREMKPNVRATSIFGDDHHAAIDAQIRALEEDMDADNIDEEFEFEPDNIREGAQQAIDWRDDFLNDDEDKAPSEDWKDLWTDPNAPAEEKE